MTNNELEQLCRRTVRLAEETAAFIRGEVGRVSDGAIEEKEVNSLVSYVDRQAEERLVSGLGKLLPGAVFLTEEDTVENQEGDLQWIIDPLDGTTNFLYGLPCFAVSVALRREGELALGVVYEVNRREAFYAWQAGGAFLNDHPIRVRANDRLDRSLLATGFPYYDYERVRPYLTVFEQFMQNTRGLRRWGSAAVDLAYVAAGRFDGFFEYSLHAWDLAAGALLVQEAGGIVTDFRGGDDYLFGGDIIAASPAVHRAMLDRIRPAFYPEHDSV